MKKAGEHIRVNFGQDAFSFDIDGMMAVSGPSSVDFSSHRCSVDSGISPSWRKYIQCKVLGLPAILTQWHGRVLS